MTIMSDKELIHVCGDTAPEPMIKPFLQRQVRYHDECGEATSPLPEGRVDPLWTAKKVISYGLSSYGYDVRLADEFKIFTNVNSVGVDPLNISEDCFVSRKGPYCWIPPNSYILGHTIEYLDMPDDVLAMCLGKSTYARSGAIVNVTPIEPGFKGQVVIEISNSTPLPIKVYANMGISQFVFFRGNHNCLTNYATRGGKYQGQMGITLPKG